MANVLIEIEVAESNRFELLTLPINYIRTFDSGEGRGSIGSLNSDQVRSVTLQDGNDSDFTIFEGPTFPRTMEGIDPSFGQALLRDMQTGEELELPLCALQMIPLREPTEISAGSSYRIILPVDLENLHDIEGITYIDLTEVTVRIEER